MTRTVSTSHEFLMWLRRELGISEVVYFVGELAAMRKRARRRPPKKPNPQQAAHAQKIDRQIHLCDEAQWHAKVGNVHLTQRRGGSGWVYFAKRAVHRRT